MHIPTNISDLTSQQIAAEFGRWADFFSDISDNPQRLHKENRSDMGEMRIFIKALVVRENASERDYPKKLMQNVFGEIGEIRDALAHYYGKNLYPPADIQGRILGLHGLLLSLRNQYMKLS
ncbi:MAG: hypothetical protein DHS20C18_13950 [Saprospiraceae bacterium]|nr:MAG: hypothetical protein DHS20C18_13950 [Saprospiraceae bacterium]